MIALVFLTIGLLPTSAVKYPASGGADGRTARTAYSWASGLSKTMMRASDEGQRMYVTGNERSLVHEGEMRQEKKDRSPFVPVEDG